MQAGAAYMKVAGDGLVYSNSSDEYVFEIWEKPPQAVESKEQGHPDPD